jgi:hypothetical protein
MPDWTKLNFDDVGDISPQDVQIQWRFAREALRSPELSVCDNVLLDDFWD